MSDTLIGVIIGGIIGSAVPLANLFFNHYHWKRETKVEYLRSERMRLEKLFDETLNTFAESLKTEKYSSDMYSDIMMFMPKDVLDQFMEFILDKGKDDKKRKFAYADLAIAMKKVLKDIDLEIKQILS